MTNVTFPQLIQRGCRIDVHLKVVVATIGGVGIHKEPRSFNTFTSCLTEMKEWLLANGITHVAMVRSVYLKKLSASPQEYLEDCTGFVEEHHVYMLQMIRKSIAQTQGLVDELSKRIKEILIKYDNVLELLKEISGFNTKVVEDLVSEIVLDMSAFPSEKHLASWAGICPGNNESAGKKTEELLTVTNK